MKFTIDKDALGNALDRVRGIIKGGEVVILNNVLLQTADGLLRLTATDGDMEARTDVQAYVSEPGSVTAPADKLFDICRQLPEGAEIDFSTADNGRAELRAGRSKFKVMTLPALDFPTMTAPPDDAAELHMTGAELLRLFTVGSYCAHPEQARPYMAATYIERVGNAVRVVSTDGKRLVLCDAAAPEEFRPAKGTMIGPKTLPVILRGLAKMAPEERAVLTMSVAKMRAVMGPLTLTSKVLDGDYAHYEGVLASRPGHTLTVDTDEFIGAMRRILIMDMAGVMSLTHNRMELAARGAETGESHEDMVCVWGGEDRRLLINAKHMLDFLAHTRTENVQIKIGASMEPMTVSETGDGSDWRGVVVPMKGSA